MNKSVNNKNKFTNMKSEKELNADILKVTLRIQEKYPELLPFIEEMTVTIPDKQNPEINVTHLQNYYNSLLSMVEKYEINSGLNSKKIGNFSKLIIAILICEGTGILSAFLANANNNTWFDALKKPSWNPPAYLFAPVWTILYFLMGVSLWMIWKNKAPEINKRHQYFLFAAQLILNFWWSILFFKFHSLSLALVDIALMLVTILLTIFSFSYYSKSAAWLLMPYISWVTFATILNYSIWSMNH